MTENVVTVRNADPSLHTPNSDADARYLLVRTSAGLERLFARTAAASPGAEPPEWTLQPSPEINVVRPQIVCEG